MASLPDAGQKPEGPKAGRSGGFANSPISEPHQHSRGNKPSKSTGAPADVLIKSGKLAADQSRRLLLSRVSGGQRLGNPNGAAALRRAQKANLAAVQTTVAKADAHAADILPVIETLKGGGITSLNGIARTLNEREIRTARGGAWTATSVKNLMARG